MNKFVRGGIVAAIAVSASVGVAPSAFATYHNNSCESLEVCAYKDVSFGGGMADMNMNNVAFSDDAYSSGGNAHDSVSSGFNVDHAVEYWQDVNYAGKHFTLAKNFYDTSWGINQPNANDYSFDFNDQVDSSKSYTS